MAFPIVKLKPQRPERFRHPWVYDNEIAAGPPAGFENGGVVRVQDARSKTMGLGYLNSHSKIIVRYLTRRGDVTIDALFWRDWFARGSGERRKGEGEKQKSAQEHGVGPDL